MIELDNNPSGPTATGGTPYLVGTSRTRPFIANATLIGPTSTIPRATNLQGSSLYGSRFDGGILVRRNANLRIANSILSAAALPNMFITTATTNAQFMGTDPALDNTSVAINNLFEPGIASQRTRLSSNEFNPFTVTTSFNLPLQNEFIADGNSYLANYAAFKLDAALKPLAGSPALAGGSNLAPYGFVATTQRGAVRTTDVWTTESWISITEH